jgi:hypothetical protein
MGRFMLSVIFLMLVGGTGFALPDWINIYDFYGSPSSGSLAASAHTDMSNDSRVFSPMPEGGFGPSTISFQNRDSASWVGQPHTVLQFKGVVLPNDTNNYFYKIPRRGSLVLTVSDGETSDASAFFMPMPDGGFGPSTISFQNRDGFSSVHQTHAENN